MAKLYITGFANLVFVQRGAVMAPMGPAIYHDTIDITGSHLENATPIPAGVGFVIVKPDADCWFDFGKDAEAAADEHPIGAGESRFYGVMPGFKFSTLAKS